MSTGPESSDSGESVEAAVQRRFAKLIVNVEDTITLIDGDGVVQQTSGLYKPILGYPSERTADLEARGVLR